MYNTAAVYKHTKEDVYKLIPAYDIYRTYLGYSPIVGNVYISPFRKDLNPSFGVFRGRNGTLMFKDLGTGESGDAIKFAKLIEGMNTQEVIEHLYKEYTSIKPIKTINIPEVKSGEKVIYVEKIPWTEAGLAFWSQYSISIETLKHFNVTQVSKYWVNGVVKGYASEKSPMFHFEIFDKDKIYRPYYKAKRFYTNCTSSYIQGWAQLDYSKDTVIITKSMKDVMYLYELGYTAIAPNGEGHKIPEKALNILKENFKHIIVFYDFDSAGICGTKKLLKENPEFGFIFTSNKHAKDITDYHARVGEKEAKELLESKLNKSYENHFKHRPQLQSNENPDN